MYSPLLLKCPKGTPGWCCQTYRVNAHSEWTPVLPVCWAAFRVSEVRVGSRPVVGCLDQSLDPFADGRGHQRSETHGGFRTIATTVVCVC